MQLRRLTINGFKTFAGRSEFEFKDGITAVVGPNGSGKSNLSDAIRWALGEQSARLLRGTSMSDVIFAGTSARKASGMAEVTVAIDNSDRALSLDFDDVSVTRRVYKDGESQFLINGIECRLKDITELFAGTGLGKEAYAAIEQGKVDAIISSQPLDRRGIFDEASGIMRYKNRKREAERKLLDVEERINRASDILTELSEKKPILENQTLDAQCYKEAISETKSLEFALICHETAEAHSKLSKCERELEARKSEKERLESELAIIEAAFESSRVKAAGLQISYDATSARAQAATKAAGRHEMNALESRGKLSNVETRIIRAKEDLKKAEEIGREAEAGLNETQDNLRKTSLMLEDIAKSLESKSSIASLLLDESKVLDQHIDEYRSEHFARVSRVSAIRSSIASLQEKHASYEARKSRIEVILGQKREEMVNTQSQIQMLKNEIEAFGAEEKALESGIIKAKASKTAISSDLTNRIGKREALAKSLVRCEAILSGLQSMEEELEGYSPAVKAVFAASAQNRLTGMISTAAQAITVPKGLESAIESALGGQVNDIICRSSEDASKAIGYLKSTRSGRGTFLPLDLIKAQKLKPDDRLLIANGYNGIASDLISYEERVRPAIEYLLGQTAVFESLEDAISAQKKGMRVRSVTKDGEALTYGGAITGGVKHDNQNSIISRKSKASDLTDERAKLVEGIRALDEGLSVLNDAINKADYEIDGIASRQDSIRRIKTSKDYETGNLVSVSKSCSQTINMLEEELGDIEVESANSHAGIAKLMPELSKAEASVIDQGGQNEADKEKKITLANKLSEASRAHTGALVERASIEARLLAEEKIVAQCKADMQVSIQESKGLRSALDALDKEASALRQQAETEGGIAAQLDEQAETEVRRLDELKILKDQMEAEASTSENLAKNKRRRLTQSSDAEAATGMEQARAAGEFAILSSKLEKDHGIPFEKADTPATDGFDKVTAIIRIEELKAKLEALGDVNLAAGDELTAIATRIEFMASQIEDLDKAKVSLSLVIREAERTAKRQFIEMFELIRQNFIEIFSRLFGGGQADIVLTDDDEPLESGIEIICRPPGKKLSQLSLLSGGEKALAAIALIFSFLKARPAPFCMLDEIDSALDDANVDRFRELVCEYAGRSQMIIITHRRRTMEAAHRVYGVTMEENGVSKAVCVDTSEIVFQEGLV